MSQVDKVNYLPILFWFSILFLVFYFLIFSFFLPLVFTSLKVRSVIFYNIIQEIIENLYFYNFIIKLCNDRINLYSFSSVFSLFTNEWFFYFLKYSFNSVFFSEKI